MSTKEKRKFEFTDYDLAVSQERAEEVTKQIALNFKKIGTDTETISKATGLTKEEIDEL